MSKPNMGESEAREQFARGRPEEATIGVTVKSVVHLDLSPLRPPFFSITRKRGQIECSGLDGTCAKGDKVWDFCGECTFLSLMTCDVEGGGGNARVPDDRNTRLGGFPPREYLICPFYKGDRTLTCQLVFWNCT
ncbi:uncharacterized protein PV06_09234 [Exophiala oligosperma]|uniref:Uncharacterized protein n=1 Tax=Exophiala oligosperma TaxID=215243 RepID=A0A0D2D4V2_9EURO|nr:uncharacterized protein PV06_09234 [Exophiala oligosperma]KIW38253.1 hypothetical protein PV06_09234 [Exophiala oligosperma]